MKRGSKQPSWMPVFTVLEARRVVHVALRKNGGRSRAKTIVEGKDFWQRIGTAVERPDGGFTIALTAIPIDGKLVVRPPKLGEQRDPTTKTAKE